ncbi:terminase small subunit [Cupriavidus metallidurans]
MTVKPKGERKKDTAPLNARRAAFAREYVIDYNATQAAIRAGYSENTAQEQASRLMTNAEVQAAIAKEQKKRVARTEITQDRVLQEVARLAFLDIRKALNPDGTLKNIMELDDDTAAAIAGLEIFEEFTGKGEERTFVGYTKKIKLADKKGVLELLMRHMGMLNDKLKLQGDAKNPLVLLLEQLQGTAIKPVQNPPTNDE